MNQRQNRLKKSSKGFKSAKFCYHKVGWGITKWVAEVQYLYRNSVKTTLHRGISCKKKLSKINLNVFNVYPSFNNYEIVFKVQISYPFKLNKLMVAIGKKPAPGNHKSSLKNLICKLSFTRFPWTKIFYFHGKPKIILHFGGTNQNI